MNGKRGRPQKYVFWSDWQAWLLKEWFPFKQKILENDLAHMTADINTLMAERIWVRILLCGIIISIVGGAIAIILTR